MGLKNEAAKHGREGKVQVVKTEKKLTIDLVGWSDIYNWTWFVSFTHKLKQFKFLNR